MCKLTKIVFFLFLFFHLQEGYTQYYNLNFRQFTSVNGLPGSDVESLYQDSRGYIWVGTRFGLSMFDGVRFKNFIHDPEDSSSLGGSRVFKIREDGKGGLWVASENFGLTKIDLSTYKISNFPIPTTRQLEDRFINTFHIVDDRNIYIGCQTGIIHFNPKTGKYSNIELEAGNKFAEVVAFAEDQYGTLWAAGYTGEIFYRKKAQANFSKFAHKNKIEIVFQLYKHADGMIFLMTSNGIFDLNPNESAEKSSFKPNARFGAKYYITNLAIDKNGTWWLANYREGIQLYQPKNQNLQSLNVSWLSPIEPGIAFWKDILIDHDGGVWLGGEFGLYYNNSEYNKFNNYKAISNFIERFSFGRYAGISNNGEEIITVSIKGVSIYDRSINDFVSLYFSPELDKKPITYNGIIQVAPKVWWLATSHGVLELTRRADHYFMRNAPFFTRDPVLGKQNIYTISYSNEGKYWFATPENGLLSYDERKRKITQIVEFGEGANKKKIDHLDFVVTSQEGDVAIGHHRGFAIKPKGESQFFHIEQLVKEKFDFTKLSVYDMEYSNGKLWVASEADGLLRFDLQKKELKIFTMEEGLVSNSIVSLHPMGSSKLVVGTNKGLSIMHIPSETFTTFLKKDGLPSEEFEIAADHDINHEEIFMATKVGLVSFRGDELQQVMTQPKLILNAIIRNGNSLSDSLVFALSKKPYFQLKHNESLTLQFSTLHFSDDNDYLLRFRLKDDEEWKLSPSNQSISIFNLDAGNYEMTVQLIGKKSGTMSGQMFIGLEVYPVFYKTRSFRIFLLILILLILAYPVNRFIQRKLQLQQKDLEKKKLLEQERVRIAMDLHDDIGGNLTALTLMTNLLKQKGVDDSISPLVEKISEASDRMVQDMNEIVWALNITNDSINSLMSYIRQHVSQKLSESGIVFEVKEPLAYPDLFVSGRTRRNVFLIIKEIVNNAIKYSGSQKIEMKVEMGNSLKITLSDNGKGLPEELLIKANSRGGNGLNNIRKRANAIHASIQFLNEKGLTTIFELPLEEFPK